MNAYLGRMGWFGLLRRYLKMYWLKPLVAVNDAANSWTLRQFPWEPPILEIGAGDGVFSFIMHGGEYRMIDDRYDQSSPGRSGDMFDVYPEQLRLSILRPASIPYDCTVDFKWSHVRKCQETRMHRLIVAGPPEPLPFDAESFKTVFLYFPHGLIEVDKRVDYPKVLAEIRRVLRPDGTLLMTGINSVIGEYFVCYPLHKYFERLGWRRLSDYFKKLDARRYEELTGLGYSLAEWRKLLHEAGFNLEEAWSQVKPIGWLLYDIQTRPVERMLARWSKWLRLVGLKTLIKGPSIYVMLPLLALFYLAVVKPKRVTQDQREAGDIFFSFRVVPRAPHAS